MGKGGASKRKELAKYGGILLDVVKRPRETTEAKTLRTAHPHLPRPSSVTTTPQGSPLPPPPLLRRRQPPVVRRGQRRGRRPGGRPPS